MTTPEAARLYLAEHLLHVAGRRVAIFNPQDMPIASLPVIYGFNNGGSDGWWHASLLAESGDFLGGHVCSHEGYMPNDLGVLEGSRPDRHETFRTHYPDGYRMEFVPLEKVRGHAGLMAAYDRHKAKNPEEAK